MNSLYPTPSYQANSGTRFNLVPMPVPDLVQPFAEGVGLAGAEVGGPGEGGGGAGGVSGDSEEFACLAAGDCAVGVGGELLEDCWGFPVGGALGDRLEGAFAERGDEGGAFGVPGAEDAGE